jgi:carboxyl-terminal processing protease
MAGAFGVGFWVRDNQDSVSRDNIELVRQSAQKIKDRYVGEIEEPELFEGAIDGMVSTLDPYCEYFTKAEWAEFNSEQLEGKFGGVGILVEVDRETGYLKVITPIEETPAFDADVLPGDRITAVEGNSVKGKSLRAIVNEIRGEPGSKVKMTIWREGRDLFEITLTRAIIRIQSIRPKMLDDEIGYIRITDFSRMMDAFDEAVEGLRDKKLKGLIIDLRFNGGGLLDQCAELSDRFLPEGKLIVSTRGRTVRDNREITARDGNDLPDWPLVVLVNEGSASASEIFAGAMKDHKRGWLVGGKTFGKGSVQTPFRMRDRSYLKLTTARYYTPSGYSVQKIKGKRDYGLVPNYLVEMTTKENAGLIKFWNEERIRKQDPSKKVESDFNDIQLEAGIEVIQAALEKREPKVKLREVDKEKEEDQ